jgi:hypothetical protein
VSTGGDKRSRAVCIRAYELSMSGHTNRQIADLILCKTEQVPGKIKRGRHAFIFDERGKVNAKELAP